MPQQEPDLFALATLDHLGVLYHAMREGELGQQAGQGNLAATGARLVADARRTVQQLGPAVRLGAGWAGPIARALWPLHSVLAQQQQQQQSGGAPAPLLRYTRRPGPSAPHVIWAPGKPARAEGAADGDTAEACWAEAQQRLAGEALKCLGPLLDASLGAVSATDSELPGLLVAVHGLIMLAAWHCPAGPGLHDALRLEVGSRPLAAPASPAVAHSL